MNKNELQKLIEENLSTHQIAKITNKSQTNIRHWLKKYDLKTKRSIKTYESSDSKYCSNCNLIIPKINFHKDKNKLNNLSSYCKKCNTILTIERQRKFKMLCLEYKGGKCCVCGYNKSIRALEFHHINSNEKDFNISKSKLKTFNDSIKSELDKCILLCSNCHREEHDKIYSELG